jgi:hypothetical protein
MRIGLAANDLNYGLRHSIERHCCKSAFKRTQRPSRPADNFSVWQAVLFYHLKDLRDQLNRVPQWIWKAFHKFS